MGSQSNNIGEALREKMAENAADINRLQERVHESFKHRDESAESRQVWSQACGEFHDRYAELSLPGGPYPNFYAQIRAGDSAMIEVALCFLEVRPYFFRSGYHWKTILQRCKRAPMSESQSERFRRIWQRYSEWRQTRILSGERGRLVRRKLWPLLQRFYQLFPVRFADHSLDGLTTAGDLYVLLCRKLKSEPVSHPEMLNGKVRKPCGAIERNDMAASAREYEAWRRAEWAPEDVWATLAAVIRETYGLETSVEISPETALCAK